MLFRSIGDSEETVAAECEIYGEEARCDGNGTRNKICRVEKVEYEVENYGDNGGEYEHKENLAPVDMIYLYLSLALCERVSYPAYKSGKRHRSCESERFYYEDMPVEKISSVLNRKNATVRTQLTRARAMLREFMKEEDYV